MYCIRCGSQIPEGSQFCSECGVSQDGSMGSQDANAYPQELLNPDAPRGMRMFSWHTGILATIGGIVVSEVVWSLCTWTAWVVPFFFVVMIAYSILNIFYSTQVYPAYFSAKPYLTNSTTISFLNGVCGDIIFGCLWNYNLTKGNKGVSHIVFCVFESIGLSIYVLALIIFLVVGL